LFFQWTSSLKDIDSLGVHWLSLVTTINNHRNADFTDWQVWLHPDVREEAELVADLGATPLICCPEDQACEQGCKDYGYMCRRCRIPVCRECQLLLKANEVIPKGLANDNWSGYVE